MKTPEQCRDMEEIRAEIDTLDEQIIRLLGKRFGYVKAASKFKTSETSVRAPERFKAMLEQRRIWAEREELNPDAIEKMSRSGQLLHRRGNESLEAKRNLTATGEARNSDNLRKKSAT